MPLAHWGTSGAARFVESAFLADVVVPRVADLLGVCAAAIVRKLKRDMAASPSVRARTNMFTPMDWSVSAGRVARRGAGD